MTKRSFLTFLLAFAVAFLLIFKSAELSEGILKGLSICSYSVIPALFPFMALSVFICKSSAGDFLEILLKPVTHLLKIPENCGGILIAAMIGGYPSAAKCINDLTVSGGIGRKTAARLLCFCVNAGPSFIIGAVGIGVFSSIKTGILIFCAHFLSSAIIAIFLSLFSGQAEKQITHPHLTQKSNSAVFVESVLSAAESCFRMCAFIILACGALELAFQSNAFSAISGNSAAKAIFSGIFEVTAGCFSCSEIEGFPAVIISGMLCSFSGISVMLQVAAVTDESKIPLFPFFISRFLHAGLTAAFLRIFLAFSGETAAAFSVKGGNYEAILSASAPAAVSLLCMAALFLLSIIPSKNESEPFFSRYSGFFRIKKPR